MTIKEFINSVSKHPALLDEELVIVVATEQVPKGAWEGAVQISSKPIQSVLFGFNGVLLFVNPKAPALQETMIKQLPQPIAGKTPEALKHLVTAGLE